jgi:hypothetical protein
MLGNSYGITRFIGNRGRLTKCVGNYMKLPELLAIRMSSRIVKF